MDERFRIVFAGELQGHISAEEVISRLTALFKLPEAQARTLVLDGNRHVVKKNLDAKAAERYRSALEKAGMIVQVEPMAPPSEKLSLAPMEEAPSEVSQSEQTESAPAFAAGYAFVRCPACGSMRVEDGVCADCGVVREKYLARQGASTRQKAPGGESAESAADPYAAPRADLRPEPEAGEMRGPAGVPAGHGWSWIVRGFWHFKTNPLAWILTLIVLVGISILLGLIPLLGGLANGLLGAVFMGGIMLGAREQDQGEDFRVDHLFAGFREKFGQLFLVGLIYLAGALLISVLVGGVILGSMLPLMSELDPSVLEGQDPAFLMASLGPLSLIAILVGALLFIPLLMSFLFAPALVMLDGVSATEAMKLSLVGCLKNVLPFLLYGLVALVLLFVAMIPLGLGLLVVWPTLSAAIYVAYRDIYFA
jgi:hypothetical protein